MKKLSRILLMALCLLLTVSMAACGSSGTPTEATEDGIDWEIKFGDPNTPPKVIFILVDGMRPEALEYIPQVKVVKKNSLYTYSAQSVVPPITLPAHVSIFHSLDPSVHGVTGNTAITYTGTTIYDVLAANGFRSAMIYSWEPLRDLMKANNNIVYQYRKSSGVLIGESVNEELTNEALYALENEDPDFTFLYLGHPDSIGHTYEWLSEEYLTAVQSSWNRICRIIDAYSTTHTIIIGADHGGHNKSHGKDIPEDMNVPLFILGNNITPGEIQGDVSILDIMPTVVDIMGLDPVEDFQGKSLLP